MQNQHEFDIALARLAAETAAPVAGWSAVSRSRESGAQSTISADQLRHPLTGKARRLLAAVFAYAENGEHAKAIAALQEAMAKAPAVVPYAHGVLGVEYVRLGRNAEAVPELVEAAALFPHDALTHSNLAISLCLVGQTGRAEQEARLALYLNPSLEAAQLLLHDIEEARDTRARR